MARGAPWGGVERCARCDGAGLTFDKAEGHIATCTRCGGKRRELPDSHAPPAPNPRR